MTADVDLLPLYAELQGHPKLEIVKHYTRANVAHATAPLQAEIEALRAGVERVTCELMDAITRAEQLAEALRKIAALTEEFDDLDDAVGIANEALERENDDA